MDTPVDDQVRIQFAKLLDPNLRFPSAPRIVPDIHIFQMPDGVGIQFRGLELPVVVRGRLAEAALEFLLPRLDGSHTLQDLLQQCPAHLPAATLLQALSVLHSKGLLIGGGAQPPAADGGDEVLRRQLLFWGRHLGITRGATSGEEVQRRLSATRLVLVGTGLFGAATYDLLSRSGCSELRVMDWNDDGVLHRAVLQSPAPPREAVHLNTTSVEAATSQLRTWSEEADLVVTATCDAPAALFRAVNRLCLDRRCSWLHANVDGSRVDVGPFVQPYDSACYLCMELRQASMHQLAVEEHLYQEELAQERACAERVPIGEAVWAATLAASFVAGEVIRAVTGIAAPTLINAVVQVSPVIGTLGTNRILRVPRCPDCFRGEIPPHPVSGSSTKWLKARA